MAGTFLRRLLFLSINSISRKPQMWVTRFLVVAAALLALNACGPMPYYSNYPADGSRIDHPPPASGPTIGFGVGIGH
jgi:hypothetical protein